MYRPRNPYVTDKPVGNSPAFIGRSDILREVVQMLQMRKDNAIVLYGQRRIGKTSALQYLTAKLPYHGDYYPIYFDLQNQATWTLEQVINELANSIAHALHQTSPDLGEQPEAEFIDTWLPDVLDRLLENTTMVLLFDEFDVLLDAKEEQAGSSFFPYLRQLLNNHLPNLKFVFAMGRNVDDIDNIAIYLFRGIPPVKYLSFFNKEETSELVRLSEANKKLNWQADAVETVWQYTQGHPFLIQLICAKVWEHQTVSTVTPTAVEDVIVEVLDVNRKTLEWLWDGLPPAERVMVSALAEAGNQAVTEETLEKWFYENGISVFIPDLQDAPNLLQDWDWLTTVGDSYIFHVELLSRWIKENKPFKRVQQELDRIDPVADNLFQTASELYKKGQLDASVKQLRETLGLNPNHLGAHHLLADILLAQGNPEEAKQLLEKLHNYKPVAARSRLIQALLELAQQEKREARQLEYYEQVLTLEPKQPEAMAKRQKIWRQRGDKALAQDDLKTALTVYKTLGISQQVSEIESKIRERYFEFEKQFASNKRKKHYQILVLTILVLVFGGWVIKEFSPQQLEQARLENAVLDKALEQAQAQAHLERRRLEKVLKQANVEKVLFDQNAEDVKAKNTYLEKGLKRANQKIIILKEERLKLLQKTRLGKFMSQLKKGQQIVIVGSYHDRQEADKIFEKLNAKYPELFYYQADLLPQDVEYNIYQKGKFWEIFISGFYSYKSARALQKKVVKLGLITDAFVRKNPFSNSR